MVVHAGQKGFEYVPLRARHDDINQTPHLIERHKVGKHSSTRLLPYAQPLKIKNKQRTMAPATELATIPLVSGATIEDPNSPAGKIWQSTLDTVSQQEGFQRSYWGREVENPSVLQLFVGKRYIPGISITVFRNPPQSDLN